VITFSKIPDDKFASTTSQLRGCEELWIRNPKTKWPVGKGDLPVHVNN